MESWHVRTTTDEGAPVHSVHDENGLCVAFVGSSEDDANKIAAVPWLYEAARRVLISTPDSPAGKLALDNLHEAFSRAQGIGVES